MTAGKPLNQNLTAPMQLPLGYVHLNIAQHRSHQ
jgi:hypothetical protein